ncbi:hypothetical protein E6H14_05795 [Candidatus Bathyarchaeota archaeon]|nr:MAG: hypothetical protein E6H14_05795 [Candidatus Bathyarchaeota archaeon]
MGLLPEFFTLLGIEIFAAMSLVSVLLDRDIPSSAQWLFQGAAGLGLGQLVVTEGFGTSSVIDASRFWISIFYLALSVCSVVGWTMRIWVLAQDIQADRQIYWTGVIASFSIRSCGDAEDIRAVGSEGYSRRAGGVPEEGSGGIE